MTRKLPPLNAVKTFEAAARHVSFARAAKEIGVTHGAVSRQVALLEDWFGLALFQRLPSRLTLTEAGRSYAREVTAVLDRLALASMDMKQPQAPSALRINAPPTFTMRWLIRRMATFQRRRTDVEMKLITAVGPIAGHDIDVDVTIRGDDGSDIPGLTSRRFMTELIAPVCHVDLVMDGALREPGDLARHRLVTYLTEPYAWPEWLQNAGLVMAPEQEIQSFEQMYFALQAVQAGLGVGLFPLFLVIDELMSGELCVPFGALGLRKRDYRCFYRADKSQAAAIGDFEDWLLEEGQSTEQLTATWAESLGWKF